MLNNKIRSIEWQIRSNVIHPIVWKMQEIFWNYFRLLIDDDNIKTLKDLSQSFNEKKVAIVWNSPQLEESWQWKKIDSYDIVIRFNKWILNNKLDSINTWLKCDFWSTWMLDTLTSINVSNQIKRTKWKLNMLIPFPYDVSNWRSVWFNIAMIELFSPYKQHPKYYLPLDFYNNLYESLESEPSSWFTLIKYIAEETSCSEIWLFWFWFSDNNRITWSTYAKQHNFKKEKILVNWFIEKYDNLELF